MSVDHVAGWRKTERLGFERVPAAVRGATMEGKE
jgi:hypothetical protein